jgi:uncharacterized damage-inducible protein DinB
VLTDMAPIDAQRSRTLDLIRSLRDADLGRIHPPTGWTVGQILGHIAASELGTSFFIRRAREGELIQMDVASRDQFNELETEKARHLDLEGLKAELADSNESLRDAFSELTETDLAKPIVWPEWPARTIGGSIPYMVDHEAGHLAQIESALGSG